MNAETWRPSSDDLQLVAYNLVRWLGGSYYCVERSESSQGRFFYVLFTSDHVQQYVMSFFYVADSDEIFKRQF